MPSSKRWQKKIANELVNFTNLINYRNIRDGAWHFLIANKIQSLPLNLDEIAQNNKWLLLSYEDNTDIAHAINKSDTLNCEGWTIIYQGHVFIFYKKNGNIGRTRFTIAHEFGHIALLHLTNLHDQEYEKEANMFAARILMPICVIKECHAFTAEEISNLCGTSLTAATYRANRLKMLMERKKFYTSPLEKQLIQQFRDFICNYMTHK